MEEPPKLVKFISSGSLLKDNESEQHTREGIAESIAVLPSVQLDEQTKEEGEEEEDENTLLEKRALESAPDDDPFGEEEDAFLSQSQEELDQEATAEALAIRQAFRQARNPVQKKRKRSEEQLEMGAQPVKKMRAGLSTVPSLTYNEEVYKPGDFVFLKPRGNELPWIVKIEILWNEEGIAGCCFRRFYRGEDIRSSTTDNKEVFCSTVVEETGVELAAIAGRCSVVKASGPPDEPNHFYYSQSYDPEKDVIHGVE